MKKITNNLVIAGISMFLLACGTKPEKAILNHWVVEETEEDNDGWGRDAKPELEFKKDGMVNIYDDGVLQANLAYSLATDGNSLVLHEPSGQEPMSIKIIELTSKKLTLLPVGSGIRSGGQDTLFLQPKKK